MDLPESNPQDVVESLAQLPSFRRVTLSPDGDRLAYYYDATGRYELYIHDMQTDEHQQITHGNLQIGPLEPIHWRATGNQVYVHQNGPDSNIHLISLEDNQVESVITGNKRYRLWDTGPDGRYVLYSRSNKGHDRQLYRYDHERNVHQQLTGSDEMVFARGNEFDPSGERIVFAATEAKSRDDLSECSIYVAESDGSNRQRLPVGRDGIRTFGKAWCPNGRRILLYETYGQERMGVYDLKTRDVRWYGDDFREEKPVTFLPDGKRFLAIRKDRVDTVPVVYTLDGRRQELEFEGVARVSPTSSWDIVRGSNEVLLHQSTTTKKGQLLQYNVVTGQGQSIRRTNYGDLDPSSFVEADYRTYDSFDGLEIGGLLYEPLYSEDPNPAIVIPHGGRHGRTIQKFDWQAQLLVQLGYVVFMPNYRGSAGRGAEFKQRKYADIGGGESEDIAAAGQWLAENPRVDSSRLGIFGHSHGGYLAALQMVTHPTLWAGGIISSGLTDLVSIYENHPDLPGLHEMGDPVDNPKLLRERSPVSYVEALEHPLLILHGTNDSACPVEQARQFRTELLNVGHIEGEDFEYHEFDERHTTMDAESKVQRWKLVRDFFERHI